MSPTRPTPSHPALRRHRLRAALFYWLWLPALVIGSGLLLDRLLGLAPWSLGPAAKGTALLLLPLGLVLIVCAERDLARFGDGTPSPLSPCRRLVTEGAFGLCRHPMALGYDLAAIAIVFCLGSPSMTLASYPLLLLWQLLSLHQEEKGLARRFCEAFPAYRARVPFLIPRLLSRPR